MVEDTKHDGAENMLDLAANIEHFISAKPMLLKISIA